jgi:hypothetical protein
MKLTPSVVVAAVLSATLAAPALAALGGDAASVQADGVHMKAAVRVTPSSTFSVHQISSAAGIVVREFVGTDGKVFAVSWSGPLNPDLRQVLGGYYGRFLQAAAAAPRNHRQLAINQPELVVQNSGRMRAFTGRAWVPGMLPQNFSVADIK